MLDKTVWRDLGLDLRFWIGSGILELWFNRIFITSNLPCIINIICVAHLVVLEVILLDRHPNIYPDGLEEVPEVHGCGICGVYVDVPLEMWADETHEG
jgi:hypothetical protein